MNLLEAIEERRARIADLTAEIRPVTKLPANPRKFRDTTTPAPRREPVQLHTVARSVLLYCLDALQAELASDARIRRQVAVQMLRDELGAASLSGRER